MLASHRGAATRPQIWYDDHNRCTLIKSRWLRIASVGEPRGFNYCMDLGGCVAVRASHCPRAVLKPATTGQARRGATRAQISDGPDPSHDLWGEVYSEHPVVKRAQNQGVHWSRVKPIALYTDGVQYSNNDSFNGIYMHDLRSGKKILFACLRTGSVVH